MLALATPVRAQVAASLALESQYRSRGVALSDGRPALSLNLSYDHGSGGYAGGSIIGEDTAHEGVQMLGSMEYLGYVKRLGAGPALDGGISNVNLVGYNASRKYNLNYTELYAGITTEHLGFHIYYSPNYARAGVDTVYMDLSGAIRPVDKWRLFGHLGVFEPVSANSGYHERYDARVGVAREFKAFELLLAWTTSGPQVTRAGGPPPKPDALILGATYFF